MSGPGTFAHVRSIWTTTEDSAARVGRVQVNSWACQVQASWEPVTPVIVAAVGTDPVITTSVAAAGPPLVTSVAAPTGPTGDELVGGIAVLPRLDRQVDRHGHGRQRRLGDVRRRVGIREVAGDADPEDVTAADLERGQADGDEGQVSPRRIRSGPHDARFPSMVHRWEDVPVMASRRHPSGTATSHVTSGTIDGPRLSILIVRLVWLADDRRGRTGWRIVATRSPVGRERARRGSRATFGWGSGSGSGWSPTTVASNDEGTGGPGQVET